MLRHLLIIFHRELTREHISKNEYLDHEMDNAVTFFSENYNQNISIDDYAASRGMSVSWFIRNFKKYTGSTPMQFMWESELTMPRCYLKQQPIPSMKFLKSSGMIISFISAGFSTS